MGSVFYAFPGHRLTCPSGDTDMPSVFLADRGDFTDCGNGLTRWAGASEDEKKGEGRDLRRLPEILQVSRRRSGLPLLSGTALLGVAGVSRRSMATAPMDRERSGLGDQEMEGRMKTTMDLTTRVFLAWLDGLDAFIYREAARKFPTNATAQEAFRMGGIKILQQMRETIIGDPG